MKQLEYKTPGGRVYTLFARALEEKHLLIAGATGSGKSVFVAGMIQTIMASRLPLDISDGAGLILIDPKRVELSDYRRLPHCIAYASEPASIQTALQQAMAICEQRYRAMQAKREKLYTGADIYVIIDEYADLVTTQKRKTEPIIQRLAQIGRAAKIHIVLCTQTPISKVLSTEIKCNFDARIGLRTRSAQDSRNILGKPGLELLPRHGECIYMAPGMEDHYKVPLVQQSELDSLVSYWEAQQQKKRLKRRKELRKIVATPKNQDRGHSPGGNTMKKTYYMINNDINPDSVYGSDHPVCLDAAEVERLGNEWGVNLFEQMHEASDEEITEYGIYK